MSTWITKVYFQCVIRYLLFFKSTELFSRINQLDWYKSTLRDWFNTQDLARNNRVLEVGCATGALTEYIAEAGFVPVGADLSKRMIELAKAKNARLEFKVASVFDLPFETGSFDAVIAASLINIVPDKTKAMTELSRVCKRGGTVSVLVPAAGFESRDMRALQLALEISDFSAAALEAWHQRPPKMSAGDVSQLFKEAGLTEITTWNYLQGMVLSVSAVKAV